MFGDLASYRHEVSQGVMQDLRANGIPEIEIESYLNSMDYAVTLRTAHASKKYPVADLRAELVLILTENRSGMRDKVKGWAAARQRKELPG